ncbi:MAG: Holliday junction branch migration protein RuvA [Actinomycetota bacterium]
MIAFVRGRVTAVTGTEVVLDVGGVGLAVQCTPATAADARVGEDATFAASLVVREDSLTLYGFGDADERQVFELLQTASGVGPRLAQAMLSVHRPSELRRAVASEDLAALTQVPGIGRKGAQRIVVELRDKLAAGRPPDGVDAASAAPSNGHGPASAANDWRRQVHSALLGLGWSAREADGAVERVAPMVGDGLDPADVPSLLKAALRTLAK